MALTQDQIAELFRKQGFLFDINNPVSLERYTIMDAVGEQFQPITLNQLNQRDPVGFAEKLEQHLRDGNVICYDARATYPKATALSLGAGSDTLQMAQYDTVPTPPVAEPRFLGVKRFFQNWFSGWKAQVTQYDTAVRLTEQRTAQVQHFDNPQVQREHDRVTTTYEMVHYQSIREAEAYRGEQLQPMHYPEESMLRDKFAKLGKTSTTVDAFLRDMNYHLDRTFDKNADAIYRSARKNPALLGTIHLDEKTLSDYKNVLNKRPEAYKIAKYAELGGFVSSLIPPVYSQQFYSVLMNRNFDDTTSPSEITRDYAHFLGGISNMVGSNSPKKPEPYTQNSGAQELWERCGEVSQDMMQQFESFQYSLDSTLADRQLINRVPLEEAKYTSANLSTLKLENVNPKIAEFLNKNSSTIQYLKELVTTVASNSSVITEENRKLLETCNTLSVQLTRMTEAIRKGDAAIEVRLEDSSKLRDPDFQSLMESPEIKKAMLPVAQQKLLDEGIKVPENEPQAQQNEPQPLEEAQRIELLQKEYNQLRKAEVENYKKMADEADDRKVEALIHPPVQVAQAKVAVSKPATLQEINDEFDAMFRAMGGTHPLGEDPKEKELPKPEPVEDGKKKLLADQEKWKVDDKSLNGFLNSSNKDRLKHVFLNESQKQFEQELQKWQKIEDRPLVKQAYLDYYQGRIAFCKESRERFSDYKIALAGDMEQRKKDLSDWSKVKSGALKTATNPEQKRAYDAGWRINGLFAAAANPLDLAQNGCDFMTKGLSKYKNPKVLSGGTTFADKYREEIELCGALCAPSGLKGSSTGKALAKLAVHKKHPRQPGDLAVASGLFEYALNGKTPPEALNPILSSVLPEGRKYAAEVMKDYKEGRPEKMCQMLEKGITVMTKLLSTMPMDAVAAQDSSWTITAGCLRTAMLAYEKVEAPNKPPLDKNVLEAANGWIAAYKVYNDCNMSQHLLNHPDGIDRGYVHSAKSIKAEVQGLCISTVANFDAYKVSQNANTNAMDPLQVLQLRNGYSMDGSKTYAVAALAKDPNLMGNLLAKHSTEQDYDSLTKTEEANRLKLEVSREQVAKQLSSSASKLEKAPEKQVAPQKAPEQPKKAPVPSR